MKFDWRTDDDGNWDRPLTEAQIPEAPSRSHHWPVALLATGLVLILAGGVIFLIVNRQVERSVNNEKTKILATHLLVRQAAAENDQDLLTSVLPGSEPRWVESQSKLLRSRLFLRRESMGLSFIANLQRAEESPSPEIHLNPDLSSAEVVDLFPFLVHSTEGVSETVFLERVFFYQKVKENWHLALTLEDADFWGSWTTVENEYLTLIFPQRDDEIGLRLSSHLKTLVTELCETRTIVCGAEFHLELQLGRDTYSLMRLNEHYQNMGFVGPSGIIQVTLPAPTLVGRPVDEAGYQALYRGYAGWVASILVDGYSKSATGPTPQFPDEASVASTLAQWGLQPPPLPYGPLPGPAPFLTEIPADLLPREDALLLCNVSDGLRLVRYDPAANRWFEELGANSVLRFPRERPERRATMYPLPDDSGVFIQVYRPEESRETRWQTYVVRGGEERLVAARGGEILALPTIFQRAADPQEQYLVVTNLARDQPEDEQIAFIDLQACIEGPECVLQYPHGLPYWAPDHKHLLILGISEEGSQLQLSLFSADGEELGVYESSLFPIWLQNETFILARPGEPPQGDGLDLMAGSEVVVVQVDDPESTEVVLTSEDLREAIDDETTPKQLEITTIKMLSTESAMAFITAAGEGDGNQVKEYLFAASEGSGGSALITYLGDLGEARVSLPPVVTGHGTDGDSYLTFAGFETTDIGATDWVVFALDLPLDTEDKSLFKYDAPDGAFDWSADGEWLVTVVESGLRIISPANDYARLAPHDLGDCTEAAWVDRRP